MRSPEERARAQARAWRERERRRIWWDAYREARSVGIPQSDARDRADTMVAHFDTRRRHV